MAAVATVAALAAWGAAAHAGVGRDASAPGVVDPVAPQITIIVPGENEAYVALEEAVFHWTTADDSPGTSPGDYVARIVVDETTLAEVDYLAGYDEFYWTWLVPEVVTGSAQLEVLAMDAFANQTVVTSPDFSILAVGTPAPEVGPVRVRLLPPQPNPCNPSTEIVFELPQTVRAAVAVYDVRGRRVRRLLDAELPAGRHTTTWYGRDDSDRPVAAGVYAVILRTETGIRSVQKVVLVP